MKMIAFSEFIYYVADVVLFKRESNIIDAIKCITGLSMINGAMWTICAMIVIQLVIYFMKVSLKSNSSYVLASLAGCIVYIFITIVRNRGPWEMQSCCAFIIGAYVAEHESKVRTMLKDKYRSIVFSSVSVFTFAFVMPYIAEMLFEYDYAAIRVVLGTISSSSFIIVMLCMISKMRIGNRSIQFVGEIATEIYFIHYYWILSSIIYQPCISIVFQRRLLLLLL